MWLFFIYLAEIFVKTSLNISAILDESLTEFPSLSVKLDIRLTDFFLALIIDLIPDHSIFMFPEYVAK